MINRFIHLLYVPTMACNMECKYCYLEDNTIDEKASYKPVETLDYAIKKLKEKNVIPFNISLHGGEVTTLSKKDFRDLIKYISDYYKDNAKLISENGFKVGDPHIKTNLLNIDKHIDTIKEFNVSISGSLDLPFRLHNEFRVTKNKQKTLEIILKNIELLKDLPNKKKVSATIFKEHYKYIDDIIKDIKYLDENTCLDMNDFNFMIGFAYNSNNLLHPLSEEEQVAFFERMHKEFANTSLDKGLNGAWFNEFGPEYCTNCDNCGEKFFLLERSGDVYSCVRGQKHENFYYGNIYKDSVEDILTNAYIKIFNNHHKLGFNEDCKICPYLYICKTGCPFVKNVYSSNKSYTCKLQQELYKKRNYEPDQYREENLYHYLSIMHPELMENNRPHRQNIDGTPTLEELVANDEHLKYIYDNECFILNVDGNEYKLSSQILKDNREIIYLTDQSKIKIYIKNTLLDEETLYPQNNALYIMLLSGDLITYGDEERTKQRHIMSQQIYKDVLASNDSDKEGYFCYDITNLLREYSKYISKEKPNNLFFTTNALRDYHYLKQKNNAYYHIAAINLPFQNIEFYYIKGE